MIPAKLRSTVGSIRYYIDVYGWPGGMIQWAGESYVRQTKSQPGQNIFDSEWDVLILLDGCRVDVLSAMQEEYAFVDTVESFDSLGSSTSEWMAATFDGVAASELRQTAYICANPFSRRFLASSDFYTLDEVWQYAWDEKLGTVPPRPVTDRTISVARSRNPERILVHYLQPHVPFIGSLGSTPLNIANFGGPQEVLVVDDWARVRRGERGLEDVWEDYRQNLRLVLDDIGLLLENLAADNVVITSDHGNAAGEFGIYGHPDNVPLPCLLEVPWVETTATDKRTYEPNVYDTSGTLDVDSRLAALGYRPESDSNN